MTRRLLRKERLSKRRDLLQYDPHEVIDDGFPEKLFLSRLAQHQRRIVGVVTGQRQRLPFEQLAQRLSLPFIILDVSASHDELRRRIVARKGDVSDANLAVLENQISSSQPFRDDEHACVYKIDTQSGNAALVQLYQQLSALAFA